MPWEDLDSHLYFALFTRSLSTFFFSHFVVVNFWDIVIFMVSVAAELLGFVCFSMHLCYILIFLNWVPKYIAKFAAFFFGGIFVMIPMHICMNM